MELVILSQMYGTTQNKMVSLGIGTQNEEGENMARNKK
jgi:hypothetical protein